MDLGTAFQAGVCAIAAVCLLAAFLGDGSKS